MYTFTDTFLFRAIYFLQEDKISNGIEKGLMAHFLSEIKIVYIFVWAL